MKLIVLPAGLVLAVLGLAVLVGWLRLALPDADSLAAALEQEGPARWQAAVTLADMLRDPARADLKKNPKLAARLAAILDRQLQAGGTQPEQVTLRMYLCRALGEFQLPDVLPVLMRAAADGGQREADVRRSAIEAIAVLGSSLGPENVRQYEGLMPLLLQAARDPQAPLRSSAAFTLGVLGGAEAEKQLTAMLRDVYPDVRYNAATGLARHGNTACLGVLLEMLDANETAGIDVEKQEAARPFKRALILINALRAVEQLAAANRSADLAPVKPAVVRLSHADVSPQVRISAREVLRSLP